MHFQSRIVIAVAAVFTTLLCQYAVGQEAQSNPVRQPEASKGLPPRATPADYQTHAQIGKLTLAAEFDGHSIPDPQTVLSTEDYLVVEVGLFGAPGSSLTLNYQDFSARINGKKSLFPARAYALVFKSLKDPDWAPPVPAGSKSKTSLSTGGKAKNEDGTEVIVHVPIEVERAMEQRVQKASLPGGERPLPAAGLIFFQYRGKPDGIRTIELIYAGPAGKATLALQP